MHRRSTSACEAPLPLNVISNRYRAEFRTKCEFAVSLAMAREARKDMQSKKILLKASGATNGKLSR